jgi:hypothetical protein
MKATVIRQRPLTRGTAGQVSTKLSTVIRAPPRYEEETLVYFAGHISTAKEIVERYKHERVESWEETKAWVDLFKCLIAKGNCPHG